LLHTDENEALRLAQKEVSHFADLYKNNWIRGMREKLGIFNEEVADKALIEELLSIMQKYGADYTNTFRVLTSGKIEDNILFGKEEFDKWYKRWQERLMRQEESEIFSRELMERSNPAVIPRNHRVEEALEAAVNQGDYSVMELLLDALSKPYDHSRKLNYYTTSPETSTCPYRTYCGT